MKILFSLLLLSGIAGAAILPASRGGTGANIIPVNGYIVVSTSSGFAVVPSLTIPAGGTVVLAAGSTVLNGAPLYIQVGSTLATPQKGAFETNGVDLYWTDSTGARYKLNKTLSN